MERPHQHLRGGVLAHVGGGHHRERDPDEHVVDGPAEHGQPPELGRDGGHPPPAPVDEAGDRPVGDRVGAQGEEARRARQEQLGGVLEAGCPYRPGGRGVRTQVPTSGNSCAVGNFESEADDGESIAASLHLPERFREIVEAHFAEIYAYLARRAGRGVAEDLAAECFAQAFRNRASFEGHRGSARPWLFGIATNLLRHHRRDEFRRLAAYVRAASLEARADDGTDAVAVRLDAAAAIERIADAFAQLDEDKRDALYLVAVVGLSYLEAAEALGVRAGTVHSRVARARAQLRDLADLSGQHFIGEEEAPHD